MVEYLPLNYRELNIDVDKAKKRVEGLCREGRPPKLVMFGGSVFPFPHPVRELAEIFREVGGTIAYDAAHVAGLIAGGRFQDPLREGADVVTLSTHKTLPGPQHGAVVSLEKHAERIKRATFPGLVSNHHLHAVAGLPSCALRCWSLGEDTLNKSSRIPRLWAKPSTRGLQRIGGAQRLQ